MGGDDKTEKNDDDDVDEQGEGRALDLRPCLAALVGVVTVGVAVVW